VHYLSPWVLRDAREEVESNLMNAAPGISDRPVSRSLSGGGKLAWKLR
jgi:hypothetical protein